MLSKLAKPSQRDGIDARIARRNVQRRLFRLVVIGIVILLGNRSSSSQPPSLAPATCDVADISTYGEFKLGSTDDSTGILFYTVAPPIDTTMTDYVRDSSGQWPLDLGADSKSTIQFAIMTPTEPYRISVDLRVNDVPFREFQQRGVRDAIKAARAGENSRGQPTSQPSNTSRRASTGTDEASSISQPSSGRVKAESYRRSGVAEKLIGYLRSQKSLAKDLASDDEELQWMISQWLPGGRVLIASPEFGLRHQHTATLFSLIAGTDDVISDQEIRDSVKIVRDADQDGDSITSLRELVEAGTPRPSPLWPSASMLKQVDATPNPDLSLFVSVTPEGGWCSTSMLSAGTSIGASTSLGGEAVPDAESEIAAGNHQIEQTTRFGRLTVIPVMDQRTWISPIESGQFSIGAMLMPNPLMGIVDTRPDGQLDAKEIMALPSTLRRLDIDGDRNVTTDEVPLRIVLAICQGPWANRLLDEASPSTLHIASRATTSAPDWFTGMDSNEDGLLVRFEFLGSDDQFRGLDLDGDGVLSADEAQSKN